MDAAQQQAYLQWLNTVAPPGSLGDSFLGGPIQPIASAFAVPTVTVLRELIGSAGAVALVMGYTTLGDKAAVTYNWSASASGADNGGSIIKPTATSGNGRWLLPDVGGWLNLVDFGGGLGGTDDSAALVAAVGTGFNIRLPVGTTVLNTLTDGVCVNIATSGQRVEGAGTDLSDVTTTMTTGVLFQLSADWTSIAKMKISGATDGWMISCNGGGSAAPNTLVEDIWFSNTAGCIVQCDKSQRSVCRNFYVTGCTGGTASIVDGSSNALKALFYGWGTSGNSGPWFLSDVVTSTAPNGPDNQPFVALYLNGACNSGTYENIYINNADTGVLLQNVLSAPKGPNFSQFRNVQLQTPYCSIANAGWSLQAGEDTFIGPLCYLNNVGQAIKLRTTGDIHSNTTLDNLASTAGIVEGLLAVGTGIPPNTTVASISGSSVTLSQAATITNSGVTVTFSVTNSSASGINVTAGVTGVTRITGLDINGCNNIGIEIHGSGVLIDGGRVCNSNNNGQNPTVPNISIFSAVTSAIITNLVGMGGTGPAGQPAYDIVIASGATNVTLSKNQYSASTAFVQDNSGVATVVPPIAGLSFTPTMTFVTPGDLSVSYATQVGRYWVNNNIIEFLARISFTPTFTTSSGAFQIAGLPVTSGGAAAGGQSSLMISKWAGVTLDSGYTQIGAEVLSQATSIELFESGSTKSVAALAPSNFTSGTAVTIDLRGSYALS